MLPNQYYYIIGTLILGIVWLIIFLSRKDLRVQILRMSTFVTIFGITEHFWYYGAYWTPQWILKIPYVNAGVKDFLLCFFYGGIAAGLYEFALKKHLVKDNRYNKFERKVVSLLAVFVGVITVLFMEYFLKAGIIFSSGWGIVAAGLVILYFRKDLLRPALLNFVLMLVVVFIWQASTRLLFPDMYQTFWNIENVSGKYFAGVLLEEYFFHASMAFGIGPLFEVFYGYADK